MAGEQGLALQHAGMHAHACVCECCSWLCAFLLKTLLLHFNLAGKEQW